MKAAVFTGHGSIDVLEVQDLPTPEPKDHEVLIRIHSFALNRLDIWTREGMANLKLSFPHIGSSDFAGTIAKLGSNVKDFRIGDRVIVNPTISCGRCAHCLNGEISLCNNFAILGEHLWGGAAEYALAPATNLLIIPDHITFNETVAISLTGMTVYRMLKRANIKPGDTVLVPGAGGGIGTIAIQLAKYFGGNVIAVTSSQKKIDKCIELGAFAGVNYKDTPEWHKTIMEITEKRGVDIIVDSSGQAVFEKSMRVLAKNGRYVTCGATTGVKGSVNLAAIFWKQLSIIGSTMASHTEFREALTLFFEDKITPVIDGIFSFDAIKAAYEKLEDPNHLGKIVVEIIKENQN